MSYLDVGAADCALNMSLKMSPCIAIAWMANLKSTLTLLIIIGEVMQLCYYVVLKSVLLPDWNRYRISVPKAHILYWQPCYLLDHYYSYMTMAR